MGEGVERKIDELFNSFSLQSIFEKFVFSHLKSDFPICGFFFSGAGVI